VVQTVLILIQNFSPGGFRTFFDAESKNVVSFSSPALAHLGSLGVTCRHHGAHHALVRSEERQTSERHGLSSFRQI
jgi:hypothetical protein